MVYPFSKEVVNIIRIVQQQRVEDELILSIPRGWQYVEEQGNMDASEYTWGETIGCNMTNEFDEYLACVQEVIILDCEQREQLEQDYYNKMKKTLEQGKKLICYVKLTHEKKEAITQLAIDNQTYVEFIENQIVQEKKINGKLQVIDSPVVGMGNLLSDEAKNDGMSGIAYYLKEKGYRPCIITQNRNMCMLQDIDVYIIEKKEQVDVESIIELNESIKMIETKKRVDVFLVSLPGTMMKYSNEIFNDFSLEVYRYTQAIDYDYFIINTLVGEYTQEFYSSIIDCFEKKYGFVADAFCIENKTLDVAESIEMHYAVINKLPYTIIDQYLDEIGKQDNGWKLYNGSIMKTYEEIAENIVSKLTQEIIVA